MKLSGQAIQILEELKQKSPMTVESLESQGYDQAMVNRAGLELQEEGLAELDEEEIKEYVLTEKGENVKEKGSPEYRLVEQIEGSLEISEVEDINVDVALGKARGKGWIEIQDGEIYLTVEGENAEDKIVDILKSQKYSEELGERGLVDKQLKVERTLKLTDKGEEVSLDNVEQDFNIESRVKTPRTGKKHFYKEIMDYARKSWVEMGFEEMKGNYVVPGFLTFDALYIPQDHPARELQDTFFMEEPFESDLSEYGDKVEKVGNTHENGWTTGSTGWQYDWNKDEAERNVLRTHTTSVSARRLHEMDINQEELPKKFFVIGRCFRNETVDRTHLAGFYQTDGIVVGNDLNFSNLKGYISEFFEKMGFGDIRLIPSYYPYTEMSVEVQVWDEVEQEWMGMGGAGMFRPEVVKPLLGFEAKVLAWGLGIPRIAMKSANLKDIRELYRSDIEILEKTSIWRPDKEEV